MKPTLVAVKRDPLYTDNYADDGPKYLPYGTVEEGTILGSKAGAS